MTIQLFDRRTLLVGTTAGLLTLPALLKADGEYGIFKMGIQSYSLRHFPIDEALKMTHDLGLKYIEIYPEHLPMTDDPKKLAEYHDMLRRHEIRLWSYGVVSFHNDEKDARRVFDFAKAMSIRTISAYPTLDSAEMLDRLANEYKINIAIHNHGPGDKLYDLIEKEAKAFEGRSVRYGACEDTGHRLRSDEDPAEAIAKWGKRVHSIHMKDVKGGKGEEKEFTELGKGSLRAAAIINTLTVNKFRGILALEYEEHEDDPIPYIKPCLVTAKKLTNKVS